MAERHAIKPVRVWAIIDETGAIRISQLRTTETAAQETASGWQYRSRKHRIVEVEIRPLSSIKEGGVE